MSLLTLKLALLATIFAAGWMGAALPRLRALEASDRFLGRGNAFAAGVLIGTALLHMLAEAHRAWTDLGWEYPIAYLLAAAAFVGVLLVEHVLLPEQAHEIVHGHAGHSVTEREMHAVSHSASPYLLVAALSTHSLIEGAALGAQDGVAQLVVISVAILAHKATAGFALGVSLARHGVARGRSLRLALLFAVMTPLGIVAGLTVSGLLAPGVEARFDALALAVAAGTFLYIASLDTIQDELLRPGSRLVKWIFAALGLAATALLAVWI
ncbi:MAG: ZIP family metal transporter [Thermoanaerobaculia bacterium]|nr:ZIP family metal transporter [Thermoanaerobaculia bacterium]